MEIRDYINAGTQKLGSQKALAEQLAQFSETLRSARAGKRGLPNDACIKLAQLLDADPLQVIAASELVTEKKPEKRDFWLQYTSAEAKNPCLRDAGDQVSGVRCQETGDRVSSLCHPPE
jgi:hypothetical protein